jgi:hypothetical protein
MERVKSDIDITFTMTADSISRTFEKTVKTLGYDPVECAVGIAQRQSGGHEKCCYKNKT